MSIQDQLKELNKGLKKNRYQVCPKCEVIVERIDGCRHMTCTICEAQFCIDCGAIKYKECGHFELPGNDSPRMINRV
jgi:hypothetical protein